MLDNLNGSNEADILKRISTSRGNSEPEQPTEDPQAVDVDEPEEVETPEIAGEEAETGESIVEEVESADTESAPIEEPEEFYVDIDGREITFSQIKEWEQGHLRQSDYTRKTQGVAEDRKSVEADRELLTGKVSKLDDSIAQLEVLIDEKKDAIDWDDLREFDPGEYLKQKELQDNRKDALKKAKSAKSSVSDGDKADIAKREQSLLIQSNPTWIKDGKATDVYTKDMSMVNDYLASQGYTAADQQEIVSARHWQAILDAARFNSGKKSNASIAKKVKKAPIVTKPGSASKSPVSLDLERAKSLHKKNGTVETALALRKLQKKFKA